MIQAMVERLLPIPHHPRTDEADALACALCLAISLKLRALEKSGGTNRTYATARRGLGSYGRGARSAWTALVEKKDPKK